jgi:outer membrane protein assembly factor BamB
MPLRYAAANRLLEQSVAGGVDARSVAGSRRHCGSGRSLQRSRGTQAEPRRIAAAPAFDARRLTANPTRDWITNGGNIFNQRYSPLTRLDRANVGDLKSLWRTGMGTGANPNNSGQAQILHYEGALYVINGANDVFALDVDTGAILWTYRGTPDPRAGVPMGRSSRGVTMGEGKIFVGLNDARLVALDQRTGEVVWSVEAERWQDGFSITNAPLYYDGMVITGFSGGEMTSRGKVKAFSARDGKPLWTFNTIPGPGEFGHDTWPQDSNAWQFGGAPVWQTPAVDPELGLVYFSTGNPGPDMHGGVRAGDNLFSVSIVAVEARTGKYRWHFQEDLPAPAANQVYMGGRFTQADADDRGILAALDVTTNKLAWRQAWREICYSGGRLARRRHVGRVPPAVRTDRLRSVARRRRARCGRASGRLAVRSLGAV